MKTDSVNYEILRTDEGEGVNEVSEGCFIGRFVRWIRGLLDQGSLAVRVQATAQQYTQPPLDDNKLKGKAQVRKWLQDEYGLV